MSKHKKDVGAVLHEGYASFRVWAPFARAVDLTGSFNEWERQPMESEEDGYWSTKVKHAKAGQEYKFVIHNNGKELFKNDPRALHLTTSAGNSVIVDPNFDWEGDAFVPLPIQQQILYELHVGTFYRLDPSESGTFQSAIEKLDYLRDLGITTIEVMPVASMSVDRSWWGYVSDYIYAVESQYGGRHAFLEFVKAAHQRGMAVILDVVYNHLDADREFDLWQYDGWSQDGKGGIYFYSDWRSHTPWGETRLDYGRPEVRQYILDNVRMWMQECHVDGFRLDSTGYVRTVDGHDHANEDIPDAWSLLQEITTLGRKLKPGALLIAEDFSGNDMITRTVEEGGTGFTSQWELNIPYVLRCALEIVKDGDHHLGEVSSALSRVYNNDVFQRVIYSDSHDTAANGNARLNEQVSPGDPSSLPARRQTLLTSAIVMTSPGVPMLFQGQEFMQGGAFSDWQALDWTHTEKFSGMLLAHKHLIALRKNQYGNTRGLTGQSFRVLYLNEESKILAYHRWDQGGAGDDVVVVCNFTNKPHKDYFVNFPHEGTWRVRFNSDWKGYNSDFNDTQLSEVVVEKDGAALPIAPYSVLIFSQD